MPLGFWKLEDKWNETLKATDRPVTPRRHIWASEIGKSFYERYLKMTGVQPTNPPEERVLRKFAAGNWFEDQIGHILRTIGILHSAQEYVDIPETPEHLKVTGKIDFVAGGVTDWNEARARVRAVEFPEQITNVSMALIEKFEKENPEGLEKIFLEIKSVNSQVFWAKKDYLAEAYPFHVMQLYTYLRKHQHPLGRIVYISKDDLTIKEIEVRWPDEKLEKQWMDDVTQMSKFIRDGVEPPKPASIVFDARKNLKFQRNKKWQTIKGCYDTNWEVAWSNYFTLITGYKTVEEWEEKCKAELKAKNDALKAEWDAKNSVTPAA